MTSRSEFINEKLASAFEPTAEWMERNTPEAVIKRREAKSKSAKKKKPTYVPAPDESIDKDALRNELADADQFVKDVAGIAWFCPQWASTTKSDVESGWIVWDGKRLAQSESGAIIRLAKKTALKLSQIALSEASDLNEELKIERAKGEDQNLPAIKALFGKIRAKKARADQLQSESRILKIISLARVDERTLIDASELDNDPDLLNCQNGIVNLTNGELIPHDPAYRCTKITRAAYVPDAKSDALDLVLMRGLMNQNSDGKYEPDPDRIDFLRKSIGHGLYGHQRLQKFYINIGKGRDGKGTLFESLRPVLGDYAIKAAAKSFIKEKNSTHRIRDDLMNMAGARLIFASEPNRGDQMDGAFMKTMSGEDYQRARHLFKAEVEFKPICSIFLQTNHELHVDSDDHGIWERLVHIPWGPSIPAGQRDPGLRRELESKEGMEALLAWAISGAIDTHDATRIDEPDSVIKHTNAYRERMDPMAEFIAEDLRLCEPEYHNHCHITQAGLRKAYDTWLAGSGLDDGPRFKLSGKRIGQKLAEYGITSDTIRVNGKTAKVWLGVTLRKNHDDFMDYVDQQKIAHVPEADDHLNRLANIATAVPVTLLPQNIAPTPTREKNNNVDNVDNSRARARHIDVIPKNPARVDGSIPGNKVTNNNNKNVDTNNKKENLGDNQKINPSPHDQQDPPDSIELDGDGFDDPDLDDWSLF